MNNHPHATCSFAGSAKPEASRPGRRHLRHCLQLAVMSGAGAALFFWFGHRVAGAVVWTLAALLLLGLLGVPGLLAGFDRLGRGLAWLVGTAMTWLLLTPFYWVVFGFGHLLLKLRGRDPMCRKFDPSATTYWADRRHLPPAESFPRQY